MFGAHFSPKNLMPVRPDWNRMGPGVPAWFRKKLKRFDKSLQLQFLPPSNWVQPRDYNKTLRPDMYPQGGWQICRKLRNGWLHAIAVFSLTDRHGRPCNPSLETLQVLRMCRFAYRHRDAKRMESLLDDAIVNIQRAEARKSSEELRHSMREFLHISGAKQFQNRVFTGNALTDPGPRTNLPRIVVPQQTGVALG